MNRDGKFECEKCTIMNTLFFSFRSVISYTATPRTIVSLDTLSNAGKYVQDLILDTSFVQGIKEEYFLFKSSLPSSCTSSL